MGPAAFGLPILPEERCWAVTALLEEGRVMNQPIHARLLAQEPGEAVSRALALLLQRDSYLLRNDVNERSIVHRFAMYLQSELAHLDVDCEYNRDGVDPKRIEYLGLHPDYEDTEAKTVFPDVIAHRRGSDENYLVIELKKTTNRVDRRVDFAKLRGYKAHLEYRFALFIEFAADVDDPGVSEVVWV
jgi:hypothetical protein